MRNPQRLGGRWRRISLWVRRHLLVWIITATAINAALIAVTTMLMQLPGQRDSVITLAVLVVLACSAISVALPVIGYRIEEAHRQVEERRQHDQRIAALLAHSHPARLTLEHVSPGQLGATPTRYTRSDNAPYIPRTSDDEQIRAALSAPGPPFPFVLVWGPTKAGKSRTLAEALYKALPARTQVLLPVDGQALAELAHLGLPLISDGPALVYLDDLAVADLEALTATVLDAVTERAVLAATMTATRRSQILTSGGDITRTARAALARTHNHGDGHELIFRAPTPDEHAQAIKLYPGETFRGSIAETLVGGTELIAKYRAGQDTNHAGYAIVQAAIDARRAGLTRPITDTELTRLFAVYLPRIRAGMPATTTAYRDGLHQWAAVPIASQVALLTPAPVSHTDTPTTNPGWIVLDHLLSADEGTLADCPARPIPEELWAELIDLVTPADAHTITYTAYQRNQITHAITAARKATTSPDPDHAPQAAFNLGVLLDEQGDPQGAQEAYQLAINSDHPDHAPQAAFNLGFLLDEQGDPQGAQEAYQLAINSSHPDQAPKAAINLGNLLYEQGDPQGAQEAYQLAINSDHPDHAPQAAFNLGVLLKQQGDPQGAQEAYQLAINSDHPDQAPQAAFNLGVLLYEQGDPQGAQEAYQLAINSSHPDQAPKAAINLGNLLDEQGDPQGAQEAYQLAINSDHPDQAPTAATNLGVLLYEQGDPQGAQEAYQLAINSDHPDQAPTAAFNLGVLLKQQGDPQGAQEAYQLAINSDHPDQAPTAAINLGNLLDEQGDPQGAQEAYQLAINSDHPDQAPQAAFNLGVLLYEQGDPQGAQEAYQLAINSDHPDQAPKAAINLGVLLKQQGDPQGAQEAYQLAINSDHPDHAPTAAINLV
ncbi:tetratricopeptide repeat protein, partial [Streptosporangium sp. NPDC023825]|uniref:tetratricopeptide repeat protein n=1 Tax=Streptosporangium sp. NPDC023825 TaxID=3154909 RepID=UPI00342BB38D